MTTHIIHRDRPCRWVEPRQRDPRNMTHGKILPMQPEGFFARFRRWRK